MGEHGWVWSEYGYKFEGKCWALVSSRAVVIYGIGLCRQIVTWVDGLFPMEFPCLSSRAVVVAREEEGDEEPSSSSSERRGHSLANSRYHNPFLAH